MHFVLLFVPFYHFCFITKFSSVHSCYRFQTSVFWLYYYKTSLCYEICRHICNWLPRTKEYPPCLEQFSLALFAWIRGSFGIKVAGPYLTCRSEIANSCLAPPFFTITWIGVYCPPTIFVSTWFVRDSRLHHVGALFSSLKGLFTYKYGCPVAGTLQEGVHKNKTKNPQKQTVHTIYD